MFRRTLALLLFCLPLAGEDLTGLARQLESIDTNSAGVVGVAIRHLESGATIDRHGDGRFPMGSTFKVALALMVLDRADRGEVQLDRPIRVEPRDVRRWASPLAERAPEGGVDVTPRELVEAIIMTSDNTAADVLLRQYGGPAAVTAQLRRWGINNIRVDRNEGALALDAYGIRQPPPPEQWTPATLSKLMQPVSGGQQRASLEAMTRDPRDTATPRAMVDLLAKAYQGELVTPASTRMLIGWMERSLPGPKRLRGALPEGTIVAHKTGTTGTAEGFNAGTNDVGVITLPNNKGHLVIAVFLRGSTLGADERDKVIAEVARAAYDAWVR